MASSPITSWQREGEKMEVVTDFLFLGLIITVDGDCSHETRTFASWQESYDKPRQCVEKQRHYSATKVHIVKAIIFPLRPSLQLWGYDLTMYSCESWTIRKTECQRVDAFELWCWRRLLRSKISLDSREIKPVNLKGNQPWILVGRTEAEAPVSWPSDANNRLTGKVPDAGKDRAQKGKSASEDETARRHHQGNGSELGQAPGDGEGHGAGRAAVREVTKSRIRLGN